MCPGCTPPGALQTPWRSSWHTLVFCSRMLVVVLPLLSCSALPFSHSHLICPPGARAPSGLCPHWQLVLLTGAVPSEVDVS